MDWLKEIDWEKLKNPDPMFKLFTPTSAEPTDPFYLKVSKLQRMLMKQPLWLSDEYRSEPTIREAVHNYFSGNTFNVFYEAGDFQGLVGFKNIIPEFKCEMTFKIWDKSLWSKTLVRAGRDLTELYMKEFKLKRISSATADDRIRRMAEMIGFVVEGKQPNSFKWNNKFYPLILLGKYGG